MESNENIDGGTNHMRFLGILRILGSFHELPAEQQAEMMAGSMEFADSFSKSGENSVSWVFSEARRKATIDFESREGYMRICFGYPLNPCVEAELIPVADYEAAAEITLALVGNSREK